MDSIKNIQDLKETKHIPEPSLRRLPLYLSYIKSFKDSGRDFISANHIANDLKLDPTQIAKDFTYAGISGKTKVGYSIPYLINALEDFLGYNNNDSAFLVGAGNLGTSLIRYDGFKEVNFHIIAAFDNDPQKVGKKIEGVEVFHIEKFRNLSERLHVMFGIITTPAEAAQSVADLMVGWGIKAIWNFTSTKIHVPQGIVIENSSLYSNLAVLTNKLKNSLSNESF